MGLVVKFGTGAVSNSVDLQACELGSYNGVYKPFDKDRILANTRWDLNK